VPEPRSTATTQRRSGSRSASCRQLRGHGPASSAPPHPPGSELLQAVGSVTTRSRDGPSGRVEARPVCMPHLPRSRRVRRGPRSEGCAKRTASERPALLVAGSKAGGGWFSEYTASRCSGRAAALCGGLLRALGAAALACTDRRRRSGAACSCRCLPGHVLRRC
jgi:hypothetical protein